MKTSITAAAVLSTLAWASSVEAGPVAASASSTSSWTAGTLAFQTGAAPTTGSGGTSQDNDNWGGGAAGSGSGGFGSLAETFTVSTSGALSSIQVVMAGGSENFNIALYDLGTVTAFGTYPAVPGQANFVPTTSSQSQVDLLNTSDQFAYAANTGQNLYTLTFGENVTLASGELYAFAMDPTDANAAAGTWWVRGGTPNASYGNGEGWNTDSSSYAYAYQNFEGKSGPYSSGGRSFDMAVTETAVPEPSTLAFTSLGSLASLILFRRKK